MLKATFIDIDKYADTSVRELTGARQLTFYR